MEDGIVILFSEHFLSTVQVDLLLYEFNGSVFLRSYYLPYIETVSGIVVTSNLFTRLVNSFHHYYIRQEVTTPENKTNTW